MVSGDFFGAGLGLVCCALVTDSINRLTAIAARIDVLLFMAILSSKLKLHLVLAQVDIT